MAGGSIRHRVTLFPPKEKVDWLIEQLQTSTWVPEFDQLPKPQLAAIAILSGVTHSHAARFLKISRDILIYARHVYDKGTDDDWRDVITCVRGVKTVHENLGTPAGEQKKEKASKSLVLAMTWSGLSKALDELSGLPAARDVVRITMANTMRRRVIEAKLAKAVAWIKEFENEWQKANRHTSDNPDAGHGDQAAGEEYLKPPPE